MCGFCYYLGDAIAQEGLGESGEDRHSEVMVVGFARQDWIEAVLDGEEDREVYGIDYSIEHHEEYLEVKMLS